MSYFKFIRTNTPVPARVPEKLARRHVSETAALVKVSAARKQATEAKAEPITATNYHDHVREGTGGGGSSSLPHIPKWAEAAGSLVAQVGRQLLHLGREPDPPPAASRTAPEGWIDIESAPEFCSIAAAALGVTWKPSVAILCDWHRNKSQFRRPAMEKKWLYEFSPPMVVFSREGLLDLVRFKAAQILAEPKPEVPATSPSSPPRPSAADLAQERAALAAARRSPAEIVAAENAKYFAAQQVATEAAKGE